jgi:hypothetical protein
MTSAESDAAGLEVDEESDESTWTRSLSKSEQGELERRLQQQQAEVMRQQSEALRVREREGKRRRVITERLYDAQCAQWLRGLSS